MSLKSYEYNAIRNKIRLMGNRYAEALIWHNPTMVADQEKDLKEHAAIFRKASEIQMALHDAEGEVRESIKHELHERKELIEMRRQLREEEKRREALRVNEG